jgi:GDP-4-dehydro-6-deoxy-D-mannose reductase
MKVLVTGADGFVGRHLCRHLCDMGDAVLAVTGGPEAAALLGVPVSSQHCVEITDKQAVHQVFESTLPDAVVHLAGFSSVGKSHEQPEQAFLVNTLGSVHVLTAVRDFCPRARVLLVNSSEAYGSMPFGSRAREDQPLVPLSPYAASKLAAEVAGFQFQRSNQLHVLSARAFSHLGRGQSPSFAIPAFAQQLAAIAAGKATAVLKVGDLSPIRDFSHVSDVVEAYRLLLLRGEPGEAYNVASGAGRSMKSLLDELILLSRVRAEIEVDPSRLRRVELPYSVGDPAKLMRLGWAPSRSVSLALADALAEALAAR